mgnify:CR=1 FL=1
MKAIEWRHGAIVRESCCSRCGTGMNLPRVLAWMLGMVCDILCGAQAVDLRGRRFGAHALAPYWLACACGGHPADRRESCRVPLRKSIVPVALDTARAIHSLAAARKDAATAAWKSSDWWRNQLTPTHLTSPAISEEGGCGGGIAAE